MPAKTRDRTWHPGPDVPRILLSQPRWFAKLRQLAGERRLEVVTRHAHAVLHAAVRHFRPVRVYACFSGGYDSASAVVTAFDALYRQHDLPVDLEILHINTGIGIEATRQYVRDFARDRALPFREVRTPESYEDIVLAKGFPGPAMHARMYQRLKERAIRIAVAQAKQGHPRSAHVMLVSGIRHDESQVRAGYRRAVSKVDAQIWVNPLYWATVDDFRRIRERHAVPPNPVKDKLGMSGECLCGAYAHKGELALIRYVCPATADYLEDLERQVRAAGHPWGWEDPGPPRKRKAKGPEPGVYAPDAGDFRPMCANCDKIKMIPSGEAEACPILPSALPARRSPT